MNDFLLIFMGIFILLLIFLLFILLAYVYHTYTTYTVDINKNLELSEDTINNTSKAFNKLEDNVINELAKVNKNQETIVKTLPDNLISLNSNLLNIFEISNNSNKITDITKTKIDYDSLGVVKPFTSYKNFTTITDKDTNFLTICNNRTEIDKKACIRMNIDDSDMFNIYTCNINRNSSNIKGINIYDSNNSILASFDAFNKKISLGSNVNPAISINNNVYTPDVIVCKYSYTPTVIAPTENQINDAINSTTYARNSITQMLTDLNIAIGTMTAVSEKNSAQSYYGTANTKKIAADTISSITIVNALTVINLVNEAYMAANSAAIIATTASATNINAVNLLLLIIKSNIDAALNKITIANVIASQSKITLNIISNIPINTSTFINLPIFDTFTISTENQSPATNISYSRNLLKFKPAVAIVKNTFINIDINISDLSGRPTSSTTTGYITAI
jgi:hypothetical protein